MPRYKGRVVNRILKLNPDRLIGIRTGGSADYQAYVKRNVTVGYMGYMLCPGTGKLNTTHCNAFDNVSVTR